MRKHRNPCMIITVVLAIGLLISGCSKTSVTSTSTSVVTSTSAPTSVSTPTTSATTSTTTGRPTATTVPPTTPAGPYGSLRVAVSAFGGESFDPIKESSTALFSIQAPMFDFMLGLSGIELTAGVVEKWQVAADGLSWTYSIRKGIKFHNGDDLTAKDIKFSFERYLLKDAYKVTVLAAVVDRVEVIDDYAVRIYTKGTKPYLPAMNSPFLPNRGLVMPKNYIEKNGMDYFNRYPVGSGPWKFVRHIGGDSAEYEAMPQHWRQSPAFKSLSVILAPEESVRAAMLKTGGIDAIDVGIETGINLEKAGFAVPVQDSLSVFLMLIGNYNPGAGGMPTANIKVRQALSLAINRDEIGNSFFRAKMRPAMAPCTSEIATDIDVAYWKSFGAQLNRYDPAQAKQLLKDAGYANGFNIKIWTAPLSGAPYLPDLAQIIQGYWSAIGVKVELAPTDYSNINVWKVKPSPQIIGTVVVQRQPTAPFTYDELQIFYSATQRSFWLVDQTTPELDKLIMAAQSEIDDAKRRAAIAQAVGMVSDTYTRLEIGFAPSLVAVGSKVEFKFPYPAYGITFYADTAKHKG